jgi:hypothetical protein
MSEQHLVLSNLILVYKRVHALFSCLPVSRFGSPPKAEKAAGSDTKVKPLNDRNMNEELTKGPVYVFHKGQ